jgi:hypothetical protein
MGIAHAGIALSYPIWTKQVFLAYGSCTEREKLSENIKMPTLFPE